MQLSEFYFILSKSSADFHISKIYTIITLLAIWIGIEMVGTGLLNFDTFKGFLI